jgi:hypothetical protein
MKPVRIDFSGARPATPGRALALFAFGAALCIAAVWRVNAFSLREARAQADLARARTALTARKPPAAAPLVLPEARVSAINAAIVQLNLPWQALFESIEQAKPKNIAILSLEPDGRKRILRVLAESKAADDMLDFVRMLREQPRFADATLTRHEINLQDPNRPLRFTLEVSWKSGL